MIYFLYAGVAKVYLLDDSPVRKFYQRSEGRYDTSDYSFHFILDVDSFSSDPDHEQRLGFVRHAISSEGFADL